jgi:RNA polymerase sigma-70 factor (ECF subfamily)
MPVEPIEQTDEDLVRQVVGGDTSLFEKLMRRYNERIYRVARAIVRDDHEAEDVMQQAYVNAFTHLDQFNGSARFSTWLTRIAVNESLARLRRQDRYLPLHDRLAESGLQNPERRAIVRELRGHLETAIDELPDGTREVFVLRAVQDLSTAEVAACLDISEDVVKTRLSRARAALRRILLERVSPAVVDVFRFYRPRCDRVVAAVLVRIEVIR